MFRLIFVFIFAVCLIFKAQSAEAHSLLPNTYSNSGSYQISTAIPSTMPAALFVAASTQDENGCKDGCCSSMMACCVAAIPQSFEMPLHQASIGLFIIPHSPLAQGPPFTLLRPPKFTA